jgi:hypothetical protein
MGEGGEGWTMGRGMCDKIEEMGEGKAVSQKTPSSSIFT